MCGVIATGEELQQLQQQHQQQQLAEETALALIKKREMKT